MNFWTRRACRGSVDFEPRFGGDPQWVLDDNALQLVHAGDALQLAQAVDALVRAVDALLLVQAVDTL